MLQTVSELLEQQDDDFIDIAEMLKNNPLLQDLDLSGEKDESSQRLFAASHLLNKARCVTLKPLLPLLLNLKGKPYHLDNHFPFEPFFRTRMSRMTLLKTGRQVSKSTSLASQGVVFSNCIPHFSTLYVTPLYEMIRRFSQNYVRPFIETSPVGRLFVGSESTQNVLQRSFQNRSQLLFSFASLDAERIRGISADKNVIDEVQDLDMTFLPIIRETMSGSPWGLSQFAGTPKSLDNTIEQLWQDSSQAEWGIKCRRCGRWNIPSMDLDLEAMIGPARDDISEEHPAVLCAKCQKPVYPRDGRWIHRYRDRRWSFAGYHVPQVIMPMHYADPEKWEILLNKKAGKGNTPIHVFYNEVCGESYDTGSRLVTVTDLRRAACLQHENRLDDALKVIHDYPQRILAVDWGGGGEKGISLTTLAVLGATPTGKIDCIWGMRSLTPHDQEREARLIIGAISQFQCSHLVHDYTGAGALREQFVAQAGFPRKNIIPIAYTGPATGSIMKFRPKTAAHPRDFYQVDKSRSLLLTCHQIKNGNLRFFKYDYRSSDEAGLLHDFLALVEEISEARAGTGRHLILREQNMSDDFAQACNIGCCALWYMTSKWPDLAEAATMHVDPASLGATRPAEAVEWGDI